MEAEDFTDYDVLKHLTGEPSVAAIFRILDRHQDLSLLFRDDMRPDPSRVAHISDKLIPHARAVTNRAAFRAAQPGCKLPKHSQRHETPRPYGRGLMPSA